MFSETKYSLAKTAEKSSTKVLCRSLQVCFYLKQPENSLTSIKTPQQSSNQNIVVYF